MALSKHARARIFLESARMVYWDGDAQAYFARAGTLTGAQQNRINDLVLGIKRGLGLNRLSDRFDAIWLLANETTTAALQNLVKNDHHCVAVSSPTFTAFQGYAGNGSSSYLRTDYLPNTDKVTWSQDAVHLSAYVRTGRTDNASLATFGARTGTNELTIATRFTSTFLARMNESAAGLNNSTSQGFYVAVRTAAAVVARYRNAVTLTAGNTSSTGIPTHEMYIGARNVDGSAAAFNTDQIAFCSIGGILTADEVGKFTTALERYMDSIGTAAS